MKREHSFYGKCAQLTAGDLLMPEQYEEISRLIFETDPYLYPAIFGEGDKGEQKAIDILPSVFESGKDAMFAKNNLFVLFNKERVIGLILWCDKGMKWDSQVLLDIANEKGIEIEKENIARVQSEYVDSRYSDEKQTQKLISLINVCVDRNFRGVGAGTYMLECFVNEHFEEPMELAVLADNSPGIRLYQRFGFRIEQEVDGFSLSPEKPKCMIMKREPVVFNA